MMVCRYIWTMGGTTSDTSNSNDHPTFGIWTIFVVKTQIIKISPGNNPRALLMEFPRKRRSDRRFPLRRTAVRHFFSFDKRKGQGEQGSQGLKCSIRATPTGTRAKATHIPMSGQRGEKAPPGASRELTTKPQN